MLNAELKRRNVNFRADDTKTVFVELIIGDMLRNTVVVAASADREPIRQNKQLDMYKKKAMHAFLIFLIQQECLLLRLRLSQRWNNTERGVLYTSGSNTVELVTLLVKSIASGKAITSLEAARDNQ